MESTKQTRLDAVARYKAESGAPPTTGSDAQALIGIVASALDSGGPSASAAAWQAADRYPTIFASSGFTLDALALAGLGEHMVRSKKE